jgi:hypothetical protein
MLTCALAPLLDARTVLYKTYLKLDNAIKALVKVDPVCKLMMSVPGVRTRDGAVVQGRR